MDTVFWILRCSFIVKVLSFVRISFLVFVAACGFLVVEVPPPLGNNTGRRLLRDSTVDAVLVSREP